MHKSTSYIFTENIALPQLFLTYFVNSNKLPGFCVGGTLAVLVLRKIKTWNGDRKQRDVGVLQCFYNESNKEGKVHRTIEWRRN